MLLFILCAGVLVALVLCSLAPALFNRKTLNQTDLEQVNLEIARQRLHAVAVPQHENADDRWELEAALLDDLQGPDYHLSKNRPTGVWAGMLVILAIPAIAAALYGWLGDRQWQIQMALPTQSEIQANSAASMQTLLSRLEQALQENPESVEGWTAAAQAYTATGQYQAAERAYARVHALAGDDAHILTAWAEAGLRANGNQYDQRIAARIERALELDPARPGALWMAAMGQNSMGNTEQALDYLMRLRSMLANDPEAMQRVDNMIQTVRSQAPELNPQQLGTNTLDEPVPTATRTIRVAVSLKPALQNQVRPEDSVFVFARAPDGPPFPLAAVRLTAAALPAVVLLDNSSAMMPGKNITSVEQVAVTARISKSGSPTARPGDLTSGAVMVTTTDNSSLNLSIDQTVE